MKTWLIGITLAAVTLALAPHDADAKRLGGGKSTGMQRDMPARTAPDSAPGKPATPATPQQGTPANQAQAPAAAGAAAAAAPAKRSWLGPIAGLAAGLGLAALLSHFGLGEGFASMLMLVLLAVVAFVAIRFLMRRFMPQPAAPMARAGGPAGQVAWPAPGSAASAGPGPSAPEVPSAAVEPPLAANDAPARPAAAPVFVPASFDHEGFERAAKLIFIRLQAANDAGDLDDLRSFTTPEMYASIRLELQERGSARQQTDVVRVEARVIDVAEESERQVVSVRYTGEVREDAGTAPVAFDEVWHLVKAREGRDWAVAGIEQMA